MFIFDCGESTKDVAVVASEANERSADRIPMSSSVIHPLQARQSFNESSNGVSGFVHFCTLLLVEMEIGCISPVGSPYSLCLVNPCKSRMEIRLSSFKREHSLKELLSKDMSEYWATDDVLPHSIQIAFDKIRYVQSVQLFLSFTQDDSYTPEKIEVRSGLTRESIKPISSVTLVEPEGLFTLNVGRRCFYIQIIINSNHQEGKDTHIRHLKILESCNKEIYYNI